MTPKLEPQNRMDLVDQSSIRSIEVDQTDIGDLLGTGGFCSVYDVSLELFNSESDSMGSRSSLFAQEGSSAKEKGEFSLHHTILSNLEDCSSSSLWSATSTINTQQLYALKKVKSDVFKCPEQREVATEDLSNEVAILSQLPEHPHIIRLQAVSPDLCKKSDMKKKDDDEGCSSSLPRVSSSSRIYMVLEKLQSTLDDRLKRWERHFKYLPRSRGALISSEADRLLEAGVMGIAKALEFLHTQKLIFRDLKPANIGFTSDGNVRLFDFGLARYMPQRGDGDNKTGYCTTFVGTLRYMAPEVMADQQPGYNQSVDVYSLGMVLWEICALEKPFGKPRSMEQLKRWVAKGKNRPCMRKVASPKMRQLISSCINPSAQERPLPTAIVKKLGIEL